MIKPYAVATLIAAARETGRTDRDVFDMLTDAEMSAIFDSFLNVFKSVNTVYRVIMDGIDFVDRKIDCIKAVRALGIKEGELPCSIGLKVAKDFVEGHQPLQLNQDQINRFHAYLAMNFPRATIRIVA